MTETTGYYGVVQYCPDPSRLEGANIGVILFCPKIEYLEAQLTTGNDRARRFFNLAGASLKDLNNAKQSLKSRLEYDKANFRDVADFNSFIDTRTGKLRITQARTVRVTDPNEVLQNLFRDLVWHRKPSIRRSPRIPELEQFFRSEAVRSRVQFDKVITLPVIQTEMTIPFVYMNGSLNLIKPQNFASDPKTAFVTATQLAVEGDLIAKHDIPEFGSTGKLIVIAGDKNESTDRTTLRRIGDLLSEYRVESVFQDELPRFINRVKRELRA